MAPIIIGHYPPTVVTAIAGINSATVSWNSGRKSYNGINIYNTITGYTITPSIGTAVTVGNVLSATVYGLTNGTEVTFKVYTMFSTTNSTNSVASSPVTPTGPVSTTVPDAPTSVTANAGNNGSITVTWLAASDGGSIITGYRVIPSIGSSVTVGNVLTTTISGLTYGTGVTFTVVAINAKGDSDPPSLPSASVIPVGPPDAPTITSVIAVGDRSATISWTAPTNTGGLPIFKYRVTSSSGGFVVDNLPGETVTTTISGLTKATSYTFTVEATNSAAFSSSVTSDSVIAVGNPDAPTITSTEAVGDRSVVISWTAPTNTGGAPITNYRVTSSPGGFVVDNLPVSAVTTTISGLTKAISYTFTVEATNSAAFSSSVTSGSVAPAAPPSSILDLTGVSGDSSATVSWSPPVSNGGSAITGYKVICTPNNNQTNIAGPDARSLVVSGLKNRESTLLTVVALSAGGQSDSITLTTSSLPHV